MSHNLNWYDYDIDPYIYSNNRKYYCFHTYAFAINIQKTSADISTNHNKNHEYIDNRTWIDTLSSSNNISKHELKCAYEGCDEYYQLINNKSTLNGAHVNIILFDVITSQFRKLNNKFIVSLCSKHNNSTNIKKFRLKDNTIAYKLSTDGNYIINASITKNLKIYKFLCKSMRPNSIVDYAVADSLVGESYKRLLNKN